ncbi:MAG: hypothetical protein JSS79_12295 [Bacteroidetes bacterium]|nr:hypothetical protein [Bacteroidota bacterium]
MIFRSHIYDRKDIDDSPKWGGFVFLFLFFILGYLLTDVIESLGKAILIGCALATPIFLYKDWGKKKPEGKYVGELILTGDRFIIGENTVDTSSITDLKIEIGNPKGFKEWGRYTYTLSSGTTSKMEVTAKGVKHQFNFLLFSDSQLKELRVVLEQLYSKGIFVKEFYLGNRTYLFEELGYEEIQEFKRKYKLR